MRRIKNISFFPAETLWDSGKLKLKWGNLLCPRVLSTSKLFVQKRCEINQRSSASKWTDHPDVPLRSAADSWWLKQINQQRFCEDQPSQDHFRPLCQGIKQFQMCGRAQMRLSSDQRRNKNKTRESGLTIYLLHLAGNKSWNEQWNADCSFFSMINFKLYFFPLLSNSCLFSAPVYSPRRIEVSLHKLGTLTKMDACFYIPQRWRFFLLILTGPLGIHTVYISAHRWDGCSQCSDTESPTHSKLFI